MVDIFGKFQEAFNSDDEDPDKINSQLNAMLETATPEEIKIYDRVFIALCGWSLTTLASKQKI